MELALRTGWTPGTIGSLPAAFRRACHWRLWVGAVIGPEGLPPLAAPEPGAPADAYRRWGEARRARAAFDAAAFPEGEG